MTCYHQLSIIETLQRAQILIGLLEHGKGVSSMATKENTRRSSLDRELVKAMGACLRLVLDDLRAQYRHVKSEAERLEKAGVAVGKIYKQLDIEKEVKQTNGKTNANRRVQRT
jgi:hypothetical protein